MNENKQQIVLVNPLLTRVRQELKHEPPGMVTTPEMIRRLLTEALDARDSKRTSGKKASKGQTLERPPLILPVEESEPTKASPWKLKGNGASIVETTVKPSPEASPPKVEASTPPTPETKPEPILESKPMELAKNLEGVTLKVDPVKLAAIVAEESEENPETYSPEELGKDTSILDGLEDYLK